MDDRIRKLATMEVPGPRTIREMRTALGLGQGELVRLMRKARDPIEISQPYLSKIERAEEGGGYAVSYRTFLSIFRFLQRRLQERARIGTAISLSKGQPETVGLDKSLAAAVRIMKDNAFSQLPVIDADGDYVGRITERDVMDLYERALRGGGRRPVAELRVKDVMRRDPFPRVREEATALEVAHLLESNEAVLVKDDEGKITGIVTRADLMAKYVEEGKGKEEKGRTTLRYFG